MKIKKINSELPIIYKRGKAEKVLFAFVFLLFGLYAFSMFAAFFWLLVNSFQNKTIYELNSVNGVTFAFPKKLYWSNYAYALKELSYNGSSIWNMFFNSIWYTFVCVGGSCLMSAFTGYAISKYDFGAKGLIYGIIIFTMTIPTVGSTGAMFKLVKSIGIYDTPFYAILTHLSGTGLTFLVMYGFFKNISWSYAEAASIDGAGHFQIFFQIMLPQALPAVGTLAIIQGIGAWNDYMTILLYMPSMPTLASGMYGISRTLPRMGYSTIYFAALVISLIPVLVVFVSFSDVIMKNFTVGGLKG